ncbi:MAG: hypothetical protein CSA97_02375 [Bacteroidetes bacterium]|nr:MAG: hypothetical protein CSA97_02375 [Bacteroidota bacterium]
MKELKFDIERLDWLLLALQVVLVALMLLLGFAPRLGWSASNVFLLLSGFALLGVVFLQSRRGSRSVQALARRDEEIEALRTDYDMLSVRLEREKQAREREEQAREQGERLERVARERLAGETREELIGSLFRAFSTEQQLVQGVYYSPDGGGGYRLGQSFALYSGSEVLSAFARGETLVGQVALEGKPLYLDDIPPAYRVIVSGLGRSAPRRLLIWPLVGAGGRDLGVLELAFFTEHSTWSREVVEGVMSDFTSRMDELSA